MQLNNQHPRTLPEPILKALEGYWGINLPQPFRSFLIQTNGGEPKNALFNFKNEKEGSDVRAFLGIYPDPPINLLAFLKTYRNRIPDNTFPIAYDSFGNLILISVKNADRGKIYFWDHEREAGDGEIPDYSNLTLIADSFDDFINNLKSEEDLGL